jgi:hypothetical protein
MKALFPSAWKVTLLAVFAGGLPLMLVAQTPAPPVTITLKNRHGHAVPHRCGCSHTGGGNTDVQQPSPDTVVFTMTGAALTAPHPKGSSASMNFDLDQCFEVAFASPKVKKAKISLNGTVIGLLRGDKHGGCASVDSGSAQVTCGPANLLSVHIEPHSVCGCENLSINDNVGPVSGPITPGEYHFAQFFNISASHKAHLIGKASSAEFAPDPALDPLWMSYREPFHGAAKKDFGFKVILRVESDD